MWVRAHVCAGLHAWLPDMAGVKELLEMVDSGLQKNAAEEVVIAGVRMSVRVSNNMRVHAVSNTCVCEGGFRCVWGR